MVIYEAKANHGLRMEGAVTLESCRGGDGPPPAFIVGLILDKSVSLTLVTRIE